MKRTLKFVILVVLAIPFIVTSCKKGENDPFISLKSRNARLVGEWKISESTVSNTSNYTYDGSTYTQTTSTVGSENVNDISYTSTETVTETFTVGSNSTTTITTTTGTGTISTNKITFEKDGVFKMEEIKTINFKETVEGQSGISEWSESTNSLMNGIWYWAAENKTIETKNKEVIVFQITSSFYSYTKTGDQTGDGSSTQTYTGNDCPQMHYKIDKLTSKDMVIMEDDSYASGDYSSTSSTISTLTKE
ncbi:MAG: hypothetical protein ABIJ97_10110 [Bacteroidota bacterium]